MLLSTGPLVTPATPFVSTGFMPPPNGHVKQLQAVLEAPSTGRECPADHLPPEVHTVSPSITTGHGQGAHPTLAVVGGELPPMHPLAQL